MGDTTNRVVGAINQVQTKVVDFLTDYGLQIIGALIILTIGLAIAWWLGRVLQQWLEKKHVEPPIVMLVVRVVRLLILLVCLLMHQQPNRQTFHLLNHS